MGELNQGMPNSRANWYFNCARPMLSMPSGFQRRNRKSTIVVPLENGDQQTADQLTKVLMGIYKRERVYETISDAFYQGACVTGMVLLHVFLDWQNDPISGDIKVEICNYNSFFIDPYFRNKDLSDCSFIWRRSYLSHVAAAALMPDKYDEIMALPGNPTGTGRDGKFQYMPESYGQSQQNKLAYDEYYYRSYRKQTLLVDKMTGDTMEIANQDRLDIDRFLAENPQVEKITQDIPTVRLAIMIQDKVFYDGPQPIAGLDDYPFVPVIGYYNPMMPYFYSRIQGLARSLRDPQMLFNRRVILSLDTVESVVNSGFIYKEDSVVDPKHLFQTGQGRIIPIKQDAQISDVQQVQTPHVDASIFQLQETLSDLMSKVTGITQELIGMNYDDKSGYRSFLQQNAGLTTLQSLFDNLDFSQNMLGDLIIRVLQGNYTPGKVKRMLEGEEPSPWFYNKSFGKYHCAVEAGFNTETQKQLQFAQLMQLRENNINIPDSDMIEAATIQNKNKIIERMQQQAQQAQQMQQMQLQAQIQEQSARTDLAHARAIADRGLGIERVSRVQENQALAQERKAEAIKDDSEALLNQVKLLKEIETLDMANLEKVIALYHMLQRNRENPQPTTQEPGSVS